MSLGLKWLFPKESNFHLTPSEGAGLPLSQGTINRLVVPLGFAPRPYTFKGCRTAIIPWNIRERVSIRPHWFSILYTWACNIRHRSRTRCIFWVFYLNPSIKCTSHVAVSLARNHSAQHVYIGLKIGGGAWTLTRLSRGAFGNVYMERL